LALSIHSMSSDVSYFLLKLLESPCCPSCLRGCSFFFPLRRVFGLIVVEVLGRIFFIFFELVWLFFLFFFFLVGIVFGVLVFYDNLCSYLVLGLSLWLYVLLMLVLWIFLVFLIRIYNIILWLKKRLSHSLCNENI
jgi:hypothetical protein